MVCNEYACVCMTRYLYYKRREKQKASHSLNYTQHSNSLVCVRAYDKGMSASFRRALFWPLFFSSLPFSSTFFLELKCVLVFCFDAISTIRPLSVCLSVRILHQWCSKFTNRWHTKRLYDKLAYTEYAYTRACDVSIHACVHNYALLYSLWKKPAMERCAPVLLLALSLLSCVFCFLLALDALGDVREGLEPFGYKAACRNSKVLPVSTIVSVCMYVCMNVYPHVYMYVCMYESSQVHTELNINRFLNNIYMSI